jgi:hypothetical protein
VLSAAQFFENHKECFSATKYLTIHCRTRTSSQPYLGHNRKQWFDLFRAFCDVNALLVYDGPNGEISRSFQLNHGESATQRFPSLKQLTICTSSEYLGACAQFINARKYAGYPVHLFCLKKEQRPLATEVAISCEYWEAPWLRGSFRLRL